MGASHRSGHMHTFDHLLNWTLKTGSHPFPGPNGGTCINEDASVLLAPHLRVRDVAQRHVLR
jgi:hypothetical protein